MSLVLRAHVAPSSIISRLRAETRGEHDAVEQMLDLMNASLNREGYRHRLQQFYGFYAPLEAALKFNSEHGADAARLNKTALLHHDLQQLGALIQNIPRCRDLPPLATRAEMTGCLYVLEVATLGGRMISQHARTTLGITLTTGGSFLTATVTTPEKCGKACGNFCSTAPLTRRRKTVLSPPPSPPCLPAQLVPVRAATNSNLQQQRRRAMHENIQIICPLHRPQQHKPQLAHRGIRNRTA